MHAVYLSAVMSKTVVSYIQSLPKVKMCSKYELVFSIKVGKMGEKIGGKGELSERSLPNN